MYSAKHTKDCALVAIKYSAKKNVTDWENVLNQQGPMELALLQRLSHHISHKTYELGEEIRLFS